MDAQRLIDVLQQFVKERTDLRIRESLSAMVASLQQMISSPNSAHDTAFKAALDDFNQTLERAPSNNWVPSKREILEQSSLAAFTGAGLRMAVEKILSEHGMARQIAHERLQELIGADKKRQGQPVLAGVHSRDRGILPRARR